MCKNTLPKYKHRKQTKILLWKCAKKSNTTRTVMLSNILKIPFSMEETNLKSNKNDGENIQTQNVDEMVVTQVAKEVMLKATVTVWMGGGVAAGRKWGGRTQASHWLPRPPPRVPPPRPQHSRSRHCHLPSLPSQVLVGNPFPSQRWVAPYWLLVHKTWARLCRSTLVTLACAMYQPVVHRWPLIGIV